MSQMIALGNWPSTLGHAFESPSLLVETAPGSDVFHSVPWLLGGFEVVDGSNERLSIAEVTISLNRDGSRAPADPSENDPRQADHQVFTGSEYRNAEEFFGSNRRIRIQTTRPESGDDWVLFEGFIERPQKTWSGMGTPPRSMKVWATSSIVAADREANQVHAGQWRRSRRAQMLLYEGGASQTELNKCVRVSSAACVFNPGGQGNCARELLGFTDGSRSISVPVFDDYSPPSTRPAIKWNVARILAYLWWSGLQPGVPRPSDPANLAKPYDVVNYSASAHPETLNWTSLSLAHLPWAPQYEPAHGLPLTEAGPNLYPLIEGYLDRTDEGSESDPQERALLRTPADVSVQGMTTLEAFVHVCDKVGIMLNVAHDVGPEGRVYTYLRFTVRGDRCGSGVPGGHGGFDLDTAAPAPALPGGTARLTSPDTCTSRAVYLYVSSDRFDLDQSPTTGTPAQQVAMMMRRDSAMDGSLTIDESSHRAAVVQFGNPTLYEVTATLLPGWRPDSMWDLATINESTVQAAYAQTLGATWRDRYSRAATVSGLQYRLVGRWWVLNEDGYFYTKVNGQAIYKRQAGPWNTNAIWEPFKWRTTGQVFELANRGDDGWSARRRQFLPLNSYFNGRVADPLVEISFDGGTNWFDARQCNADVSIDSDRCAITINNPDLEKITNPRPAGPGRTDYVLAYLAGDLRIRVTALVEGDDALCAWSSAGTQFDGAPWVEAVFRTGKLDRTLRYRPGTTTAAANNAIIGGANADLYVGENLDRQTDALRDAKRAAEEFAIPRICGSATIPWLWRNGFGPMVGYRVGDEVLGVQTGMATTHWSFIGNRNPRFAAPRIIGIRYRWNEREQTTTLEMEDRSFSPDGGVFDEPDRRGYADRSLRRYIDETERRRGEF